MRLVFTILLGSYPSTATCLRIGPERSYVVMKFCPRLETYARQIIESIVQQKLKVRMRLVSDSAPVALL